MSNEIGQLDVHVIDAVQLPIVSHLGKQNPFVVVLVGSERQQTKAANGGHRSPVWGDRLQFALLKGITELQLEVYHESKYGKTAFIGTATVPLNQVLSTGSCGRRVRIGEAGEIRLQLGYTRSQENQRGRSLPTAAHAASQALQNAATSLDAALPVRSNVPSALVGNSWRSKKQLQPAVTDGEGPSWLSGTNHVSRQQQLPQANSQSLNGPGPLEGGTMKDSTICEPGRRNSLNGSDKQSVSPSKSLRSRVGSKIGHLWHSREPSKGNSAHSLNVPLASDQDAEALRQHPQLVTEPSSSISAHGSSQTDDTKGRDSLENSADGGPQAALSGRLSETQMPTSRPSEQAARDHQPGLQSGIQLEPVEAVHINRGDGREAWLNRWEERHEGPRREDSSRRATDPSFPQMDRLGETSTSGAAPRRQTLDSFPGSSRPGQGSSFEQTSDDGSTAIWRSGREIIEWGERQGKMPAFPDNFHQRLPVFANDTAARPTWDTSSSHERLLSSMEEVSRSTSTRHFGSGIAGSRMGGPLGENRLGNNANSRMGLLDSARREGMPSMMDSARSDMEFGRARRPVFQGSQLPSPREADSEGESSNANLEAQARRRSGSAPASASRPIIPSYPQPQYNPSDDISERFSSLKQGNSPPLFSSAMQRMSSKDDNAPQTATISSLGKTENTEPSVGRPIRASQSPAVIRPQQSLQANDQGQGEKDLRAFGSESQPEPEAAPGSFVGMVSPFAVDTTPLQQESLPTSPDGTVGHNRTKSSGERVPMKAMRQEMEAAAQGSVRTNRAGASSESHSSLSALLSDSNKDWLIDEADLEITLDDKGRPVKLGSGSFGTVYKGVYDQSTDVAIKTLKCETSQEMDTALFEVAILKKQLHPNVLQFLGASIGGGSIQLVTELMAGNLYTALRNGNCTWHKGGKGIAKNIASALAFLHKKKVVHLDVKSANILLTSNNVGKLGDLGLSAMMDKNSFVNTIKGMGTLHWASPEVLLSTHPVSCPADVFSFGTVLWEICTGELPRRGHLRPLRKDEAPARIADLIFECLDSHPDKRPTMQEIYNVLKDLQD